MTNCGVPFAAIYRCIIALHIVCYNASVSTTLSLFYVAGARRHFSGHAKKVIRKSGNCLVRATLTPAQGRCLPYAIHVPSTKLEVPTFKNRRVRQENLALIFIA